MSKWVDIKQRPPAMNSASLGLFEDHVESGKRFLGMVYRNDEGEMLLPSGNLATSFLQTLTHWLDELPELPEKVQ